MLGAFIINDSTSLLILIYSCTLSTLSATAVGDSEVIHMKMHTLLGGKSVTNNW